MCSIYVFHDVCLVCDDFVARQENTMNALAESEDLRMLRRIFAGRLCLMYLVFSFTFFYSSSGDRMNNTLKSRPTARLHVMYGIYVYVQRARVYARALGVSVLVLAAMSLAATSCGKKEDPRWAEAEQKAKEQLAAKKEAIKEGTAAPIVEGGTLNAMFPTAGDGFERVASQEKEGFSEYKLKKAGKEMAMLAIHDINANPAAADKFKSSTRTIGGFPAVDQGSTATAVLVAGRYQVKVLSRDASFTKADREAWLAKFNLAGLAAMAKK
jgi:hypothetical protein